LKVACERTTATAQTRGPY